MIKSDGSRHRPRPISRALSCAIDGTRLSATRRTVCKDFSKFREVADAKCRKERERPNATDWLDKTDREQRWLDSMKTPLRERAQALWRDPMQNELKLAAFPPGVTRARDGDVIAAHVKRGISL